MPEEAQTYTVFLKDLGVGFATAEILFSLSGRKVIDGLDVSAQDTEQSVRIFPKLSVVEVTLTPSEYAALSARPEVRHIVRFSGTQFVTDWKEHGDVEQLQDDEQLRPNVSLIRVDKLWSDGFTGQGVNVAVLDTGVRQNHPAFGSRVKTGFSCIANSPATVDNNGHGTQCAGVLGADYGLGVAPGCTIHPVKIAAAIGGATELSIKQGFEWCLGNGIQVVSISFGDRSKANVAVYEPFVAALVAAGCIVVASCGTTAGLTAPGRCASCIGVASIDCYGNALNVPQPDDVLDNVGERVELVAPGEHIQVLDHTSVGTSTRASGPSVAAPHVAGAAALLLSAGVPAARIRELLLSSAWSSPHHNVLYGCGILDCYAAYTLSKLPRNVFTGPC